MVCKDNIEVTKHIRDMKWLVEDEELKQRFEGQYLLIGKYKPHWRTKRIYSVISLVDEIKLRQKLKLFREYNIEEDKTDSDFMPYKIYLIGNFEECQKRMDVLNEAQERWLNKKREQEEKSLNRTANAELFIREKKEKIGLCVGGISHV